MLAVTTRVLKGQRGLLVKASVTKEQPCKLQRLRQWSAGVAVGVAFGAVIAHAAPSAFADEALLQADANGAAAVELSRPASPADARRQRLHEVAAQVKQDFIQVC